MTEIRIQTLCDRWRVARLESEEDVDGVKGALSEGRADGVWVGHNRRIDLRKFVEMPNLRAVSMPFSDEFDVSVLNGVSTIEYLYLRDNLQPVNLDGFTNLITCDVVWQKGMKLPTRSRNTLLELCLWKLKTQTKDLREFDYPHLQRLDITQGTIESLDGVQQLKSLRRAVFAYLPKLRDVCVIARTPVEFVRFENCKNVADFTCLKDAARLWALNVIKSGDFKTLNILREFKHLKQFVFGGNVIDGDLSPLLDLEFVGFYPAKKHFSHTVEQIREHIVKQKGKLAPAAYSMDWPLKY